MDPKQIVADGYDQIADAYAAWVANDGGDGRQRRLRWLTTTLADGAHVLDLGCGNGVPVAQVLSERFKVTGVDISARQIALARTNAPTATFVQADMAAVQFPSDSFDAVVAFFSLLHLPRDEHAGVFQRIATWLRPSGLFLAATGARSDPGTVENDWLGAPMYWSCYSSQSTLEMLRQRGLEIVEATEDTVEEDGQPVTFLWMVARKPAVTAEAATPEVLPER